MVETEEDKEERLYTMIQTCEYLSKSCWLTGKFDFVIIIVKDHCISFYRGLKVI